jgi:hypothetical protein
LGFSVLLLVALQQSPAFRLTIRHRYSRCA